MRWLRVADTLQCDTAANNAWKAVRWGAASQLPILIYFANMCRRIDLD